VIRLRKRSGRERMGKNPQPYAFEVGFAGRVGGAIVVYVGADIDLTRTDQMEELFARALEIWERERAQIVGKPQLIVLPGTDRLSS
jgi:hypothetical protein